MNLNEVIDNHIDKITGKIRKNTRSNPVKSKEEFDNILKGFKLYNQGKSKLSVGSESIGRAPILWVNIHGKEYYLNSDTKIEGINRYLMNKENNWRLIKNSNGTLNKITNQENSEDISGFYFYKLEN